jgi:hypothetical protein
MSHRPGFLHNHRLIFFSSTPLLSRCGQGGNSMEGSTREQFVQTLMQYQEKFGQEKASAIQEKFWQLKEQIVTDSAADLDWFPSWKKNQILESLLQKTYLDLIAEMEREGLS